MMSLHLPDEAKALVEAWRDTRVRRSTRYCRRCVRPDLAQHKKERALDRLTELGLEAASHALSPLPAETPPHPLLRHSRAVVFGERYIMVGSSWA